MMYFLISEIVRFQSWNTNNACCKLQCFSFFACTLVSRDALCREKKKNNWKNIWNKLRHLVLRKETTFRACCHLGVLCCVSFNNTCPNMSIKGCLHLVTQPWVAPLHVHIYAQRGKRGVHITGLFFFWGWGRGGILFCTNQNSKNMLSLNMI